MAVSNGWIAIKSLYLHLRDPADQSSGLNSLTFPQLPPVEYNVNHWPIAGTMNFSADIHAHLRLTSSNF